MFPLVQIAQASTHVATAQGLVDKINSAILFPLIALMMALAFIIFLWGAFEYVKNANNESARETGRNHLMYGVIGMLIMLSAFAILSIAAGTFGISVQKQTTNETGSSFAPESSLRPQARPNRAPTVVAPPEVATNLDLGGFGSGVDNVDIAPDISSGSDSFTPNPRPAQPLSPEEQNLFTRYVETYAVEKLPGRTSLMDEQDRQSLLNAYKQFGVTEVLFMTDSDSYGTQEKAGALSQQEFLCRKKGGEMTLESGANKVTSRSMYACLR